MIFINPFTYGNNAPPMTYDLMTGLVRYYRGESITSGITPDETGNYDGIVSGNLQVATGKVDNTFLFDGSGATVNAGKPNLLGDSTIAFWWNPSSLSAKQNPMQYGNYNTWGSFNQFNTASNGRLFFYYGEGSGFKSFFSKVLNENTWYHIVLTRDHTNQIYKIYTDGTFNNSQTTTNTAAKSPGTSSLIIGDGYIGEVNGKLDEVCIWKDRVLSANEISYLYNGGNGRIIE